MTKKVVLPLPLGFFNPDKEKRTSIWNRRKQPRPPKTVVIPQESKKAQPKEDSHA